MLKLFLPKILNFFQLRFQKNGRKSNFKDTLLVRIKILKFCSGKKFNSLGYLQTVFRLTVIPKQETPKTINCNFCGYSGTKSLNNTYGVIRIIRSYTDFGQEKLKDIAHRSDSIGVALINILICST